MKKILLALLVVLMAMTAVFAADFHYGLEVMAGYTTDFHQGVWSEISLPELYLSIRPGIKFGNLTAILNLNTSVYPESGGFECFYNLISESYDKTDIRGIISYYSKYVHELSWKTDNLFIGMDADKKINFDSIVWAPNNNFNTGVPLVAEYDGDRVDIMAFASDLDFVFLPRDYFNELVGEEVLHNDIYYNEVGARLAVKPFRGNDTEFAFSAISQLLFNDDEAKSLSDVYICPEVSVKIPTVLGKQDIVLSAAVATEMDYYIQNEEESEQPFESFIVEFGLNTSINKFDLGVYGFFNRNELPYHGMYTYRSTPTNMIGGALTVDYHLPKGVLFMSTIVPFGMQDDLKICDGEVDVFNLGLKYGDQTWISAGIHATNFYSTLLALDETSTLIDVIDKMCGYGDIFVDVGFSTGVCDFEANFCLVRAKEINETNYNVNPGFEATFLCTINAEDFFK